MSICLVIAQAKEDAPTATPKADDGAMIWAQGTKAGATACIGCHGGQGEGLAQGGFPRVAGQSAFYLTNQLKDYASGVRQNNVMGPIAKALTESEMETVAAYLSSLPVPNMKPAKKAAAAVLKRGETLATTGDMKFQLQACNNCHGPGGMGVAPAMPSLAAQYGTYLESQINQWKSGQRRNSPDQMAIVAKHLNEKDTQALAAYFESVSLTAPAKKK